MMFYMFGDEVENIEIDEINPNLLCAGLITVGEFEKLAAVFSLPKNVVEFAKREKKQNAITKYSGDDFTFVRFDILGRGKSAKVSLIAKKNLFICVDLSPENEMVQRCFFELFSRSVCENAELEKLICTFLEIICEDVSASFDEENEIDELEKQIIDKRCDDDFNKILIEKKQELLHLRLFYEQLIDTAEVFIQNENEMFGEKAINRFKIFREKVMRFKENADILRENVIHLWDAYQTYIEVSQNEIMKLFTVITSVFLPMTVIVGWYGMNFRYMPEIQSRFGYPYVIFLNICVVFVLLYIFKKKKWI